VKTFIVLQKLIFCAAWKKYSKNLKYFGVFRALLFTLLKDLVKLATFENLANI